MHCVAKNARVLSLMTALTGLTAAGMSHGATILNGSFEDGISTSSFVSVIPSGWNYTDNSGGGSPGSGQVHVVNKSYTTPQTPVNYYPGNVDGNYFMEGTLPGSYGVLWQDVAGLTPGQEYRVDFLWGNRWQSDGVTSPTQNTFDFEISMGGSTFAASGDTGTGLQPGYITFIAGPSGTERLAIDMKATATYSNGAFDNFVLNPVPEPSGMLMAGLAGMLAVMRRRRVV